MESQFVDSIGGDEQVTSMSRLPQIPLPPDILTAGLKIFTTEEALRDWMTKPASWADGRSPAELVANGQAAEVVNALVGLAYGNIL